MDISQQYIRMTEFFRRPPHKYKIGSVRNTQSKACAGDDYAMRAQCDRTLVALELMSQGFKAYPQYLMGSTWDDLRLSLTMDGQHVSLHNTSRLLAMSEPSPYGDLRSGHTVIDESVRRCREIRNLQCKLADESFKMRIMHSLFPGHKEISIVLNKMVIYERGGHFSRHVDTPAPGVIGTLVMVLENEHGGGDLILETSDGLVRIGSGFWGAFYSSIPHYVEEVKSGHRVALTFYIKDGVDDADVFTCKDDGDDEESAEEDAVDGDADKKADADEPESAEEEKATVEPSPLGSMVAPFGVLLQEQYSITEVTPKGRDAILVSTLQSRFKVTLTHVVRSYHEIYDSEEEVDDVSDEIYEFNEAIYQDVITGTKSAVADTRRDLPFYILGDDGPEVYHRSEPSIEYTGNECQEGVLNNVYLCMAAIVE